LTGRHEICAPKIRTEKRSLNGLTRATDKKKSERTTGRRSQHGDGLLVTRAGIQAGRIDVENWLASMYLVSFSHH
jgi:hypothetical protein